MQSGPVDLGPASRGGPAPPGSPKVLFFQILPGLGDRALCLGFRGDLMVRAFDLQTTYAVYRGPGIGMKITEPQGLGGPRRRFCLGACLFLLAV